MTLSNHSIKNLSVIENFIDHFTTDETERERMKSVALQYIEEDHVDGEGSENVIAECNKEFHSSFSKYELLGTEIFLNGDIYEEDPVDLYFNPERNHFIVVPKNYFSLVREFKLTNSFDQIALEHREEILESCLGRFTKDDEVSLKDIFMQGKYYKEVV